MTRARLVLCSGLVAGGLIGGVWAPDSASAQDPMPGCRILQYRVWDGRDVSAAGDRVEYFGRPVFLCEDGRRIQVDSAVVRSPTGRSELLGHLVIEEGTEVLRAESADYYVEDGRLIARGGVVVEDLETGREIRGDALSRLPPTDYRPAEEVTVTGTPAVARVVPAGGGEPYVVRALRIVLEGEEDFRAYVDVEVDRDSLHVTSDSMTYVETDGLLRFDGNARMIASSGEFQGEQITLGLRDEEVESVRVVGRALLLASDIDLRSEEILVTLVGGQVDRLVAVRGEGEGDPTLPPPYAVTAGFFLTGDSIDARSPGGVVESVDAVGSAWGQTLEDREAVPDPGLSPSERFREGPLTLDRLDRDWIEGGAIRIEFEDGPPPEGSETPERVARRLIATEGGRALYRTPPRDGTSEADRSAWPIEYVLAPTLRLHLLDTGEVDRIEAEGGMSGAHLDPIARAAATPPSAPGDAR